ncbi:hypothetical protein [Pseudonocardia sp. UM4_GMWB1]|uniref:hypothetical protein n=1 Tax=Pseudonocardia sp. UM4_GMWB1 TaxID=2212989 RepID=UPI00307E2C69
MQLTGSVLGAVMSYVLAPQGADTTRLLLKVVMGGTRALAPLVSVGDLVMARRQLLNLGRLAGAPQPATGSLTTHRARWGATTGCDARS